MSDGTVALLPDSTGKKVDTSELTVGSNTVERQRIILADSDLPSGLAKVDPKGQLRIYDPEMMVVMLQILSQLKTITVYLSHIADESIDERDTFFEDK